MKIGNKDYELDLKTSAFWRYASENEIAMLKVDEFVRSMTVTRLFEYIAYSDKSKQLTVDYLYEQLDIDKTLHARCFETLAKAIGMGEEKPPRGGKVVKEKA